MKLKCTEEKLVELNMSKKNDSSLSFYLYIYITPSIYLRPSIHLSPLLRYKCIYNIVIPMVYIQDVQYMLMNCRALGSSDSVHKRWTIAQ